MVDAGTSDDADGVGDEKEPTTAEEPDRYLFAIDGHHSRRCLELVCDLVVDAGAMLYVGAPIVPSDRSDIGPTEARLEGERLAGKYTLDARIACKSKTQVEEVIRTGDHRGEIIRDMVETFGISTLIEEQRAGSASHFHFTDEFEEAAVRDLCDTIIVSRISQLGTVDSILVPITGGPHSGMAIDVGIALARQNDASVELLHVESKTASPEDSIGETVLATGIERAGNYDDVTRTLTEATDVAQTIVDYTTDFDITVMGAPTEDRLKQFIHGSIPREVGKVADGTVLITHRGGTRTSWLDRLI